MERRQRWVFPEAFKREAVERVVSSGLSAGAVAAELGLHETVLRRWMMQFGTQATGAARRPNTQAPPPSPSDLVSENARLRRENDRLRMERDILKNAALERPRRSRHPPPIAGRLHPRIIGVSPAEHRGCFAVSSRCARLANLL